MSCNTCVNLTYEQGKGFYCVLTGENKSQMDYCGFHEPVKIRFKGELSQVLDKPGFYGGRCSLMRDALVSLFSGDGIK